jgi:hypothetical protein
MSNNATDVALFALIVLLIVGCTASVAYWAHSPLGLWSLLALLMVNIKT